MRTFVLTWHIIDMVIIINRQKFYIFLYFSKKAQYCLPQWYKYFIWAVFSMFNKICGKVGSFMLLIVVLYLAFKLLVFERHWWIFVRQNACLECTILIMVTMMSVFTTIEDIASPLVRCELALIWSQSYFVFDLCLCFIWPFYLIWFDHFLWVVCRQNVGLAHTHLNPSKDAEFLKTKETKKTKVMTTALIWNMCLYTK